MHFISKENVHRLHSDGVTLEIEQSTMSEFNHREVIDYLA
jgi:hypothetical protein